MNFNHIVVLFCVISMVGSLGFPQSKKLVASEKTEALEKVDLATLKQFAINHNLEVQSLRRTVDEVKAQYERSKSSFYPNLSLATGVEKQVGAVKSQAGSLGYLSLNYNIFSGFGSSRKTQIAGIEAEKAVISLQSAEFKIGLEVEKVFHTVVFKKSALALKLDQLKINDLHRKMASQKRSAGMAVESDVMEFDLSDAFIKSDIVLLEQEIEEARSQLKKLLGDEVGSQVEPVGLLRHEHITRTLKDILEKIEDSSESIKMASQELSIATIQRGSWRSHWLPKVDLEGQTGYLPLDQSTDSRVISRGTVLLKWNFFDGFDTVYEKREQEFNYLKKNALLKQTVLETVTAAEIAYAKILAIQKRVDLESKNESRAKSYYSSVTSEYRRGIKNSSDLKIAAEGLFDARLRRENFKYEFLLQRLQLEGIVGFQVEAHLMDE